MTGNDFLDFITFIVFVTFVYWYSITLSENKTLQKTSLKINTHIILTLPSESLMVLPFKAESAQTVTLLRSNKIDNQRNSMNHTTYL